MDDTTKKLDAAILPIFEAFLASGSTRDTIAATEKASPADTGTFEVVITTENLDRYNEVIKLDGWDLTQYLKNPVVLWGHDHSIPPIGIALSIDILDGKMIAKGKFAPQPFAQEIRALYDLGMVRATSVGFLAKEQEGNLITKSELLEFSFVSVPANPYALALAIEKGLSVNEMVTKGFMFVKIETEQKEKGAVQDEQDAVAARQAKWKNFAEVDDIIWAFMNVYFEPATSVADFSKLLDETIGLLKKVSGGEKSGAKPSGMRAVRENYEALQALSKDTLKSILVALEDAPVSEPEGDEPVEVVSDDQKALDEFSSKRKMVQEAATILGEVLAEARQAIQASKS